MAVKVQVRLKRLLKEIATYFMLFEKMGLKYLPFIHY